MAGETNKVVIVTGGSSGIGRCTASALKENGCIVYEFSRRNIPMEGVTHLSVDVTDEDAVNAAVQQVIQKRKAKIDAVINCAGFGISGAVEFTSCLCFLGGVLFLCKKTFYIFLCPNQFLPLVPRLAVVRVSSSYWSR